MTNTDSTWGYWGKTDPYFGVITHEPFTRGRMDEPARTRFFASGQRYIEFALNTVSRYVDPDFRPTRALDFGCGVGRLTIPLADVCDSVVGVDVSDGMLEEARANVERCALTNVSFVKGDPELSQVTGKFDFLNSLIVFQHIPPPRGEAILRRMLELLTDGGVGALQFTYGFASGTPRARQALAQAYKSVPLLWSARNLVKGRPFGEPLMQMNAYDLNQLFRILYESGCELVHPHFTETGSFRSKFYGVVLFFQKRKLEDCLRI